MLFLAEMSTSINLLENLIVVLSFVSMLVGLFLHMNKVENQVLAKFCKIERMLKITLFSLKIEQGRINDLEAFLEKKIEFHRRQPTEIDFSNE